MGNLQAITNLTKMTFKTQLIREVYFFFHVMCQDNDFHFLLSTFHLPFSFFVQIIPITNFSAQPVLKVQH